MSTWNKWQREKTRKFTSGILTEVASALIAVLVIMIFRDALREVFRQARRYGVGSVRSMGEKQQELVKGKWAFCMNSGGSGGVWTLLQIACPLTREQGNVKSCRSPWFAEWCWSWNKQIHGKFYIWRKFSQQYQLYAQIIGYIGHSVCCISRALINSTSFICWLKEQQGKWIEEHSKWQ